MQIYILSTKHQNLTYKLTFDWVSMCNYSDSSLSSAIATVSKSNPNISFSCR